MQDRKFEFKDLKDGDKAYIKAIHSNSELSWDHRMSLLMKRFSKSERTIRRWIDKLGFAKSQEVISEEIRQGRSRNYDKSKKYYILTWAQNATPVHSQLWDNIKAYAEHINADIGVIQGRYQNPTSLWTENMQKDEWWDPSFSERDDDGQITFSYLDAARHRLHEYLTVASDIKIVPTASDPLTGFEGIAGDSTVILGHPRVHLRTLPTLEGHPNKFLMTTGACTVRNYTDTKAGKKAEFHHTYGFVIVEVQDKYIFHFRQVTAEQDGSFIDLIYRVQSSQVETMTDCDAFICGDIHVAGLNKPVMKKTRELFNALKPKNVVLHDLFDGDSINHHEAKDPLKMYERVKSSRHLLKNELDDLLQFFEEFDILHFNPIVVRSNHDEWLDRWIVNADWKKEVHNSEQYMEYGLALLKGDAPNGILPYILQKRYGDQVMCLGFDESFKINGWEVGQHGHLGSNGSRGNIETYRKLNTKVIVGDWHTVNRKDGAISVGTYSELRRGYNKGASSWVNSGAIIHSNSKVQHIIFAEDGNFTTLI